MTALSQHRGRNAGYGFRVDQMEGQHAIRFYTVLLDEAHWATNVLNSRIGPVGIRILHLLLQRKQLWNRQFPETPPSKVRQQIHPQQSHPNHNAREGNIT